MRPIGFSTGAIALSDFRLGMSVLRQKGVAIVELSALRQFELAPLASALEDLDISDFTYVSVHAPSQLEPEMEKEAISLLEKAAERSLPIIIHPDAITDFGLWTSFGNLLLVENMDKRKPLGRTAFELAGIFDKLPDALLCFDLGHVRQVDPTMSEAALILQLFGDRMRQLHVSEVNTRSTHDPLTAGAIGAFNRISHLIPDEVPVILESSVSEDQIETEISLARKALPGQHSKVAVAD